MLGASGGTTAENAKQAIDRLGKGKAGTHGAKELTELHEAAVVALMSTAKEVLGRIIAPAKEITPVK